MDEVTIELNWIEGVDRCDLKLPAYETTGSAGMDIEAAVADEVQIAPGEIKLIPTGVRVAIPEGYEIQVRPRSGLAVKHGITLINSPGTIDSDYRGEIKVGLINHGSKNFSVRRGDRVAQLVVSRVANAKFKVVTELSETERGEGGFGHTGV